MSTERRELSPTGILQSWVAALGLRLQGGLLTAIRGCDTSPKDGLDKAATRAVRSVILHTHCADPRQARSFIEHCEPPEIHQRLTELARSLDQYPHHWLMHMIHACEIIGYCHPDPDMRAAFEDFYFLCCKKLHMGPETKEQLLGRLDADEEVFRASQV